MIRSWSPKVALVVAPVRTGADRVARHAPNAPSAMREATKKPTTR
jgi:hypothetical protein